VVAAEIPKPPHFGLNNAVPTNPHPPQPIEIIDNFPNDNSILQETPLVKYLY
jgi:hypothetical protein